LLRFSPSDDGDDTLKIRLTCLADVWKIDAVQIDWTLVQPLKPTPVRLISAIGPESQDLTATLAVADDHYITLLPPETIHLTFQAMTPMAGQKMVYVLNAQGYLYEWPPATTSHSTTWSQTIIPENKRIDFLIDLLQHKSFFLPAIYAEWRRTKVRE